LNAGTRLKRHWRSLRKQLSPARRRVTWVASRARTVGQPRIQFTCNLCGKRGTAATTQLGRELISCSCGSTIRFRAVFEALTTALFGASCYGPDLPERTDITGLGFTDSPFYASHLARSTSYTASYYHQAPFHDLLNLSSFKGATFDYVICSDVLEHVIGEVSEAIRTLHSLLKPGGVLIFSVPLIDGTTVEHYPGVVDFELVRRGRSRYALVGRTASGDQKTFEDPTFHGGYGATVEMRLMGRDSLRQQLLDAGFEQPIEERKIVDPEIGLIWNDIPETLTRQGQEIRGLRSGVFLLRRKMLGCQWTDVTARGRT
jgi:SAM-dependent methyltransferase